MDWLDDTLCVNYDGKGERIKAHQMDGLQVSSSIKAVVTIYTEAFQEANKVFRSQIESEVLVEGGMDKGSLKWLMRLIAKEEESQLQLGEKETIKAKVLRAVQETVELVKK